MQKYVLVKARDGRIGPSPIPTESFSFNSWDDAIKEMAQDIEDEGGGSYNEDFGTGCTDDGSFAYEIFPA